MKPFEDVHRVSQKLRLVKPAQIDELEATLGFPLPLGYREYLTTLGDGEFCRLLHVATPDEILEPKRLWDWRAWIQEAIDADGWEDEPLLSDDALKSCVEFAWTSEGDSFVACPQHPGKLFELPRHEPRMIECDEEFLDPFRRLTRGRTEFRFPFFEPRDSREVEVRFRLRAGVSPTEVWQFVRGLSSAPLKVVSGDVATNYPTVAFVPGICGCVWYERHRFFCYATREHQEVLETMRRTFGAEEWTE